MVSFPRGSWTGRLKQTKLRNEKKENSIKSSSEAWIFRNSQVVMSSQTELCDDGSLGPVNLQG